VTTPQFRRDLGQLLWIGFQGTSLPAGVAARFAAGQVGAAILFRRNLAWHGDDADARFDVDALCALNGALHRAAPDDAPVLVAVDQEGGRVQRVRAPATRWPPMHGFARLADDRAVALARSIGLAIGRELHALGFDIDFAPVLDVNSNPHNPIIGDRAFGDRAEDAARRALAFADGLAAAGVLGCGKHFPGHGDTDKDSHLDLPRLAHGLERLRQVELLPFAHAAAAGVPMIMTAHVVFEALDRAVPATLSRRVIEGLLRGELGYRGVIVSDDLDMKAVADHVGVADAAVAAIEAGCDVLLLCEDEANQAIAEEALAKAGERSPAFVARVAEAAARIRAMKRDHAPRMNLAPDPNRAREVLGGDAALAVELAAGERA
jgi:beta-N-acetylhexosaminidase